MELWIHWWNVVIQLRPACSRKRTFLWLAACLAGMTVRNDFWGVTSIVRALGLKGTCYDRILDFFHSKALNLNKLTLLRSTLVLKIFTGILKTNGRILIVGDGLKIPKAGKKMPAVKLVHQQSESNTKPEFVMAHSCQAVAVLAGALNSIFAVPLASRIHEGVIFSNRDKRTLLDKMIILVDSLGICIPFYFIADAYYASRVIIRGLIDTGNHLVTRLRTNAVAYYPAPPPPESKGPGRPRKYGEKINLRSLFDQTDKFQSAQSPIYGEKNVNIQLLSLDLLWRPVGILVRFIAVIHPNRGSILLMSTDLTLPPLEIIRLYGLRFKIEVSFKQAIHCLGVYAYRFWMRGMTPIRRRSGNQYLHKKSIEYRNAVRRKLNAYHTYIQVGLIARGPLQYLSLSFSKRVWFSFGSWIRTIRPGLSPSENVVAIALKNTLPNLFANSAEQSMLIDFLRERLDLSRAEGSRLIA